MTLNFMGIRARTLRRLAYAKYCIFEKFHKCNICIDVAPVFPNMTSWFDLPIQCHFSLSRRTIFRGFGRPPLLISGLRQLSEMIGKNALYMLAVHQSDADNPSDLAYPYVKFVRD